MPTESNEGKLTLLRERGITPDEYQIQSFAAIDAGSSVLVAAPTSSGKTLVAEYAIDRALERGETVVYTTPIKAVSYTHLTLPTKRIV